MTTPPSPRSMSMSELFTVREVWTLVRANWLLVVVLAAVGTAGGVGLARLSAYARVEVTLSNIRIPGVGAQSPEADSARAVGRASEPDALSATAGGIPAIQLAEFLQLQRELAPLAASRGGLGVLGSPSWWAANMKPLLVFSPADEQVFGERPAPLEHDASRIVSIMVSADGQAPADAGALADRAVQFLRRGGAYKELTRLLETYRAEAQTLGQHYALAALRQLDVELEYLRQREAMLLGLPGGDSGSSQTMISVTGPEDARYLPRQAQLNAVRVELHDKQLEQKRLRALMQRGRILGEFVTQAKEAQASLPHDEGLALVEQWRSRALALQAADQVAEGEDALVQRAVVESILARLNMLEARFTTMLPESGRRVEHMQRLPTIRGLLIGLLGGVLLALAIGHVRRVW